MKLAGRFNERTKTLFFLFRIAVKFSTSSDNNSTNSVKGLNQV